MTVRLIDVGWNKEIQDALCADVSALRIISPFIKESALNRLLKILPRQIQVITRFNLNDFAAGVSDIKALRRLLDAGASVRGIRNLHSKVYLFGNSTAIVTSANLTTAALDRNPEFGIVSDDPSIITACCSYFDNLWTAGATDLARHRLDEWDADVSRHILAGGGPNFGGGLEDFGIDIGLPSPIPETIVHAPQAFVKFSGKSNSRAKLSLLTIDEVKGTDCHRVLTYPASKRPRIVEDGAIMFIGRFTRSDRGTNDIRVFGRGIGNRYQEGRDDATPDDIRRIGWMKDRDRFIRVRDPEFVAGTMENGVSLNALKEALKENSFAATQRHARRGHGNIDPNRAYGQHSAVELAPEGLCWLHERLEQAFRTHGRIPQTDLDAIGRPLVPQSGAR